MLGVQELRDGKPNKKASRANKNACPGYDVFGPPAKYGPQQLGYQHGETDIPDGCVLRLSGGFFFRREPGVHSVRAGIPHPSGAEAVRSGAARADADPRKAFPQRHTPQSVEKSFEVLRSL